MARCLSPQGSVLAPRAASRLREPCDPTVCGMVRGGVRMSLHGPGLMPTVAAATIHTDQLINGNAFDHIIRPVRQEKAIAFPAAPRILWGALFHPPTIYPLAG